MTNCAMLVCSFYVKKRFSRGDEKLHLLNQEITVGDDESQKVFRDIFEILSLYCADSSAFFDNEKAKKMFSIDSDNIKEYEQPTYRAISFVVKSGSYGIEADMTNRHTMAVSHHRTEDEADVKEFRCVVYVPKDAGEVKVNKGILVFQSIATYGVKTITVDTMRRYFGELGITIETRSVSIRAFLEKLIEQGALNKVTLIRNHISPNRADNMLINTGREETSYIKPNLKPEWLQKILSMFEEADKTGIVEIPDDEDFDDLSVQFKLGDRIRTVRLKNLDRLSIVEDIPEEIVSKENDKRLIEYMVETANAYKGKMVFETKSEV